MEKLRFDKFVLDDAKRLQEEALQGLREDKDVYNYIQNELRLTKGEVNANLAVLLDFQDDFHYCANCPGFDNCDKSQPHYTMSLEKDGPFVKREFSSCRLAREKQLYQARFLHRDFPDEWQEVNIMQVDKTGKRATLLKEMVLALKGDSDRWIYVNGDPGVGKTYLLAAFANTFASDHPPVAFFDCSLFIESLKNLAFSKERHAKEALNKAVDAYSRCPLLVLDGFGNEFKSEYVFSSLLFPILNARSKNELLTYFSSDFSIDEVVGDYQSKIGTLRATQFSKFLKAKTKKEFILQGLPGLY